MLQWNFLDSSASVKSVEFIEKDVGAYEWVRPELRGFEREAVNYAMRF